MRKSLVGVVVVAAVLVVGAPRARATTADPVPNHDIIFFSGSGTSATINPGVPWHFISPAGILSPSVFVFGSGGPETWPTHAPGDITDLTLTFTGLPTGRDIFFGFFATGSPSATPWHDVLSNGDRTITFTAPTGVSLNPGEEFLGSVSTNLGPHISSVNFTGAWSAPVPEPSSLVLFGTGLLLLGIIGRKLLHA